MAAILFHKAVVAQFVTEVFENLNTDRLRYLVTDDFRGRAIAPSGADAGPEEMEALVEAIRGAFSNARIRIEEMLAEGDAVGLRYTWEAEHTGEFAGVHPTGRRVRLAGILIARLRDGRISEYWRQEDQLGLLRQLGVDARLVAA